MKRIKYLLFSVLIAASSLAAQPISTANEHFRNAVNMFADKNFVGCIDQMTAAKSFGLIDYEKADLLIALATTDSPLPALNFLTDYPASQYRHIILCHIADYYLGNAGDSATALKYFANADIEALNEYDAEDASLHYAIALADQKIWEKAQTLFSSLRGTRHNNEAKFYLGYIALEQGNAKSAVSLLESVTKANSRPTADADFYLAQAYYCSKDFSRAAAISAHLIKIGENGKPNLFTEMLRINGEANYNLGKLDIAVSNLKKYEARTSHPALPALYILGEDAYNSADYTRAISCLSPVSREDCEMGQAACLLLGQAYIHCAKYDAALIATQKAYDMTFNESLRESALYNYAIAKMMGGRVPFGNSVATFEQFLREYPDSRYAPDVQKYIIRGYITDNNYDAALNSINALKSPTQETLRAKQIILYTLGCRALNSSATDNTTLNYAVGKLREAKSLAQYDKDIARECDLWIAEALYKQGNFSQAITSYKAYIKAAPNSAANRTIAFYDLGYALFGNKDYTAAFSTFKSFADSQNADATHRADALNRMGDCLYYRSDFEAAAKMYDKAFDACPSSGDYALFQMAIMKGLRREHAEKISGLKDLISRFPSSGLYPSALLEMAEAYRELGNTDMVISTYEALVAKFPNSSQCRQGLLLLAITHLNAGNKTDAIATYKRIVKDYPTSDEARVAVDDLKRIYTDDSDIASFLAFMNSVKNAPQLDSDEIEKLTFSSAERLYDKNGDIAQILEYIKDYPHGAYTAQALLIQAQNFAAKGDDLAAIKTAKQIISDFPHSSVIEDAYISLATAQTDLGMTVDALNTYRELESRASSGVTLNTARLGILRSARELGDADAMLDASDNLLASSTVGTGSHEEIIFTRGIALAQLGRNDEAAECWEQLAQDMNHLYGAKSAFYLAQHHFDAGNIPLARTYAEKIINANTPHNYWLARTFILLSDICRAEGNSFEAEEYLKSLRQNYPGSEPDIFTMIDERLNQ